MNGLVKTIAVHGTGVSEKLDKTTERVVKAVKDASDAPTKHAKVLPPGRMSVAAPSLANSLRFSQPYL